MIRRIVPVVAMAAMLGACSHNTNNAEPGTAYPSRSSQDRGPGGRGMGGAREEMALRGITLSSEQHERIERIRASYRSQMEQARQSAGDDRSAMRERMQPLMERQQAEIREVLSPDQQAQYDRNIAEMRARMQQGGRRGNG